MTGHHSPRSSLISALLTTLLAVFILTALGAFHDAQAAKRKRHHKRHAPAAAGTSAAPEAGEESAEPTGGGTSAEPSESKPPEAEPAPSSSDEAAPPPKSKKVKMEGEAAAEESPSAPSGLPWLELSIGVAGYNRNLSFHQDGDPQNNQLNPSCTSSRSPTYWGTWASKAR